MENKLQPKIRFNKYIDSWMQRKIGDFSEETLGGGTPKTSVKEFWDGEIAWIQSSDLKEHKISGVIPKKKITKLALKESAAKLIPKNSIAVVTRVGVGKVAIMDREYATSQDFVSLTQLKVDKWFAGYSLYQKLQKELLSVQGTSIKGITKSELLDKTIYVPIKMEEQNEIGVFFKNLDATISLHQQELDNLKQTKQGFLQKMFPREGETLPEVRFQQFDDEWNEKKFIDLVNRVSNQSSSEVLPKVEFEDIISGEGRLNKDISKKFDNRKGTYFKPEFILFGKLRPYLKNWLLTDFEGVALGDFWVFEAKNTDSSFIYYLIQTDMYQTVANLSTGTKMPRSDWNTVSEKEFAIPCIEEQKHIGEFFKKLDKTIELHEKELEALKETKKAFLQKMFV